MELTVTSKYIILPESFQEKISSFSSETVRNKLISEIICDIEPQEINSTNIETLKKISDTIEAEINLMLSNGGGDIETEQDGSDEQETVDEVDLTKEVESNNSLDLSEQRDKAIRVRKKSRW